MTSKEIRNMYRDGFSSWEILHYVIKDNIEYPDAVFKVSQALNFDSEQVEEMEDGYSFNA